MLDLTHLTDIASQIIAIASVVTALTPTPSPSTTLGKIYRFIEYLALVTNKTKQK